jgi:hypothetical protein
MNRITKTVTVLLASCIMSGCVSFHIRDDGVFSARYLPPWKWVQIHRANPEPKQPHLKLSVDIDYLILSKVGQATPEELARPALELVAPLLREIEAELNGREIHAVWSNRLGISMNGTDWPSFRLSDDMKYLLWTKTGLPPDEIKVVSHRAYWYACVRLAGFSTSYAQQSQAKGFVPPPETLPEKAQAALRSHPHVPPGLLRTHEWTCESGHKHQKFYVFDNGIVWILNSIDFDLSAVELFWLYPERCDAQEFDPTLAEAFASARRKVEDILKVKGIEGMGSCFAYWSELRRILKEEHGITWRSPSELNPNTMYD